MKDNMILDRIDFTDEKLELCNGSTVILTEYSALERDEMLQNIVSLLDRQLSCDHYVYCFEFGDENWYVGETKNLRDRFATHRRDKDITNIELLEEVSDKTEALERERELSYEMAIEKGTTDIYGGR